LLSGYATTPLFNSNVEISPMPNGYRQVLKAALARIANGLLIGIGFGLALFGAFYIADQYLTRSHRDGTMPEYKAFSKDSGLVIKFHEQRRTEFSSAVIGMVRNEGSDSWRGIELVVELFDKSGKFLDKCTSYESIALAPGEERNFKVSCGGCKDNPVVKYDHYAIRIEDARYVRKT
jgi:hypothetical protein